MNKPTKEQIQWLWEQCGFKFINHSRWHDTTALTGGLGYWAYPDNTTCRKLPSIDLNNLFKYAVPRLQDKGYIVEVYSYEHNDFRVRVYSIFFSPLQPEDEYPIVSQAENKDPALALFWAIYKAFGGE